MVETEARSEDDKVAQAGIKVILGGEEYSIAPLVIRDSREWRKKVGPWKARIAQYASVDSDNPKDFENTLSVLMVERIDETIDHFFAYAKDLDRKELEAKATDWEVVRAFNEVFKVAFPFD